MKLLKNLFKPSMQRNSAVLAKERLQIIVSHARSERSRRQDFLPTLQQELVDVIAKYVAIEKDQVQVALRQSDEFSSVLELNITLPEGTKKPQASVTHEAEEIT